MLGVDEELLPLPDDEAGAAVVAVEVDGAPVEDSVFAVVVEVWAAFAASPDGGFILSE